MAVSLPPLNLSASSGARTDSSGFFGGVTSGDWNVNMGGASVQGGSITTALIVLGIAWLLLRR